MEFAELHCRSNFSFLTSASHPEELIVQAHQLGYKAIAITDECSLAGVVKAHQAAKSCGIQFIVGSEFKIQFQNTTVHLVLLAPNQRAYEQLSGMITKGRRRSPKGEYQLHLSDFTDTVNACMALWIPGNLPAKNLLTQGYALKQCMTQLWLALELFLEEDDMERLSTILDLSILLQLPVVASNDVHMHVPERKVLLDTLTAIRLGKPIHDLGTTIFSNSERHLRTLDNLHRIYPREALMESMRIARQCTFSLDSLHYEYPPEVVPPGLTPAQHLRQLTYAGAHERWPQGIPNDVAQLIDKELLLIAELQYEYYFLTVYDIVRFARGRNILCQGRGSAANSAVCYCLHITEVDPDRIHVLFERFVSKERHEPPDIDVDFEHERREEVIQYIYEQYSRERAALAATVITYRPRSAIRDVGKALGFDLDLVDLLAKSMSWWDDKSVIDERLRELGLNPKEQRILLFVSLVNEILRFPRHLSQHVGGFVIASRSLSHLVPVENAAMPDRTIIQWDKDDLEEMRLLKVDVLGLGMLTAIRKALDLVNSFRGWTGGQVLTVSGIPSEDPATYEMLQKGDSVGVFQVESRAQMSMLPRLRPNCFYDLVIEVAIVRPGPIQGNMVHPYLKRRQGLEAVTYTSPEVEKVLKRTLGIPIFQEQVIELAMVAAGFTAGEADQLRRAMAAWRRRGGLQEIGAKLINGMLAKGHPREFAERIFQQIQGFGEYGFPESHAASFALLVYVSAWLKCHEPAAFYCGILNSLPMGFYSPSQLIQDAVRHDLEVRDVDVQTSGWDYRLEANERYQAQYAHSQGAIRVGLRQIKGLGKEAAIRIEAKQPFSDIDDLAQRAELNDQNLTFLARAGALSNLCGHRFQSHWDAAGVDQQTKLMQAANVNTPYFTEVELAGPTVGNDVISDFRYLGLSLGTHPVSLVREDEEFTRCSTATELVKLKPGQIVQLVGLVTCRQRPSSSAGVLFITLEDETGNSNLIVWSSMYERFRKVILQSQLLMVKGILQREGEVVHIVVGYAQDCSEKLATLASRDGTNANIISSRDFH